jgi:CRISPR/Cas system-associated exonuclease Cas4 (RecB family)
LTLQTEIKMSAYKHLKSTAMKKDSNSFETHIIPVELKSGKTTFSSEHEGQVILYSLLNQEKRMKSDFGLLLYLKDMNLKFIQVNNLSLRGNLL